MAINERHYCATLNPTPTLGSPRAALLLTERWDSGQTITVGFMGGDASLQDRVLAAARQWTGVNRANLHFEQVDAADADIRISFQAGDGSWSYLGRQCLRIPKNQATMNFGWLTPGSSDLDVQSVVLHEFGHALGLVHEHQNPIRPINWDRNAVIADLSGPPNYWDTATIEYNLFYRFNPDTLLATKMDPASIMMYSIPQSWTTDGFWTGFNATLSRRDRMLIQVAY